MTMTAGAHSSQPSRRSARAPSDSRLVRPRLLRAPPRGAVSCGRLRRVLISGRPRGGPRTAAPADQVVREEVAHGISTLGSSASSICSLIFLSVLSGSMPAGGDSVWEITIEMFW